MNKTKINEINNQTIIESEIEEEIDPFILNRTTTTTTNDTLINNSEINNQVNLPLELPNLQQINTNEEMSVEIEELQAFLETNPELLQEVANNIIEEFININDVDIPQLQEETEQLNDEIITSKKTYQWDCIKRFMWTNSVSIGLGAWTLISFYSHYKSHGATPLMLPPPPTSPVIMPPMSAAGILLPHSSSQIICEGAAATLVLKQIIKTIKFLFK